MDDKCIICGKKFIHRCYYVYVDDGLHKKVFIEAHDKCKNLMNKRKKLKEKILDLEYELFELDEKTFFIYVNIIYEIENCNPTNCWPI